MVRKRMILSVVAFSAGLLPGLVPSSFAAESHPQEVLDLIAGHEALAMKIRPLQDRVAAASGAAETGFRPEGAPLRAEVATGASSSAPERRVPETLRHRERAVTSGNELSAIRNRLSKLAEQARVERERVNQPEFGVGTRAYSGQPESGKVRFGDGRRGARLPAGAKPDNPAGADAAQSIDAGAIDDARKVLAGMQQELAELERAVGASLR